MGHTFSRILLHVVFSTQGRRNILYKNMRGKMLAYIQGIARNEGVQIIKSGAVDEHIHLLLETKPAHSPSDIVRKIKSNTSKWIHETYPNLRDFAWQRGFSAFSGSESALPEVIRYINNQEEHHHRISFGEELKRFFDRHKIQYDPKHYLD